MAGEHVDGGLEILQSELVQREHVGQRVVPGRDERIGVLRDTDLREEGTHVGAAIGGGHDWWPPWPDEYRSGNARRGDTSAQTIHQTLMYRTQMRRYTSYTFTRTWGQRGVFYTSKAGV